MSKNLKFPSVPTNPESPDPALSFEAAIERLESIVAEMESDQLGLEVLLARYEQGIQLVKVCEERLAVAEKRIEVVTRDASGEPQLRPFEAPPAVEKGDVSLF